MNNPHRLLAHCLRMCWYASTAQKPLRPDKSNHGTHRISPELCVTRFDPAACQRYCALCRGWSKAATTSVFSQTLWCSNRDAYKMLESVWIPNLPLQTSYSGVSFPPSGSNIVDRADAPTSSQSLISQHQISTDSSIWKCIKVKTQFGRLMN